jgi:predicted ATP-grasp superfamily ATP-dependent carboligase
MKKNKTLNNVIVLGAGINGLGIIRSFEKTPIPVIAMSWYKDYGMSSRFCESAICPNPLKEEEFIQFLIQYSKELSKKPVLFATSDLFLIPMVKNMDILSEFYHIPVCEWNIFSKLIKKEYLYSLAEQLDIPCPKTKNVNKAEDFEGIMNDMQFPVIIKPSVNINFSKLLGEKAYILKNRPDLDQLIEKIIKTRLYEEHIIIQEYIPGDVTSLYTITSYANKEHEIKGYSIGHKIRQYPPQTGTIISGKVIHVEDILINAERFIKATKFYGISNIEFKKDDRDNTYKLMEINPRTGLWNLSVLECGINLPLMSYNDILGKEIKQEYNKQKELIWLITPLDFYYSLWGYKKKNYPEADISFGEWKKSVKGKKVDATFKWYDPIPFFKGLMMKYR